MKKTEIVSYNRFPYFEKCVCGKQHEILTQEKESPEYETDIYLLCDCGEYVEFVLPIN